MILQVPLKTNGWRDPKMMGLGGFEWPDVDSEWGPIIVKKQLTWAKHLGAICTQRAPTTKKWFERYTSDFDKIHVEESTNSSPCLPKKSWKPNI